MHAGFLFDIKGIKMVSRTKFRVHLRTEIMESKKYHFGDKCKRINIRLVDLDSMAKALGLDRLFLHVNLDYRSAQCDATTVEVVAKINKMIKSELDMKEVERDHTMIVYKKSIDETFDFEGLRAILNNCRSSTGNAAMRRVLRKIAYLYYSHKSICPICSNTEDKIREYLILEKGS